MSGDYISRVAVLVEAEKVPLKDRNYRTYGNIVRSIPAADVVEVVRCYECIHHDEERPFHYCRRLRIDCPDDCEFYCAFGKRKDGGQDE